MKASYHCRFTHGMITRREDTPTYFIPPGQEPDEVAPPVRQTQSEQVLKIQKVKPKKSKYQRD